MDKIYIVSKLAEAIRLVLQNSAAEAEKAIKAALLQVQIESARPAS